MNHSSLALTGANGFLSRLLLKRLVELQSVKEVHIFDIEPPTVVSEKFVFHRVDLTKDAASGKMASILKENRVTAFFHGALLSTPLRQSDKHHELESIGTFHVLNAVAEAQTSRLVVRSHTFVYGPRGQNFLSIEETEPLSTKGPQFVRTRVDVEQQIQHFAEHYPRCQVLVLRFAPVLGPSAVDVRGRYFLSGFVPRALGDDPVLQFIHEDDAVRAQIMALASSATGVCHIVGRGVLPLSAGIRISGKTPLFFPPSLRKFFFFAGHTLHLSQFSPAFSQFFCVASGKKAERELGFVAHYSSRQALKSMVESARLRQVGFPSPSLALQDEAETEREYSGFRRVY